MYHAHGRSGGYLQLNKIAVILRTISARGCFQRSFSVLFQDSDSVLFQDNDSTINKQSVTEIHKLRGAPSTHSPDYAVCAAHPVQRLPSCLPQARGPGFDSRRSGTPVLAVWILLCGSSTRPCIAKLHPAVINWYGNCQ